MKKLKQWQATAILIAVLVVVVVLILSFIPGSGVVKVVVINLLLGLVVLIFFAGLPGFGGWYWAKLVKKWDKQRIDPNHDISTIGHWAIAIFSALVVGALWVLLTTWFAGAPFWESTAIGNILGYPMAFEIAPWGSGGIASGIFFVSYGLFHMMSYF